MIIPAAARNLFLLVVIVFFGLPVVWLLLATTKTPGQIRDEFPVSFGSLDNIPRAWANLNSYHGGLTPWILNSVVYSASSVLIALVICLPAGFALARLKFPGRNVVLYATLLSMLVPSAALILPLYLEMATLNLVDTALSVILPLSFFPFGTYLVYLYTQAVLPESLIEAARIDGAGGFQIIVRIFLPLASPVVATVGFFRFAQSWNEFFLPTLMLTSLDKQTLQTGLSFLISSSGALSGQGNFNNLPIQETELALSAVITILPILVVFLFAQRYLANAQTAGAVKG